MMEFSEVEDNSKSFQEHQYGFHTEFIGKCAISETPLSNSKSLNDEGHSAIKEGFIEANIDYDETIKEFGCAEDNCKNNKSDDQRMSSDDEENVPLLTLIQNNSLNIKQKIISANKLDSSKKNTDNYKTKKRITKNDTSKKAFNEDIVPRKKFSTPEEIKQWEKVIDSYFGELKCELCNTDIENYKMLKLHFREMHKKQAFVMCCDKKFERPFTLHDHVQAHLNPEYFKCGTCGKILKSRVCLELHVSNMHLDRDLQKYGCEICKKKFPRRSLLQVHKLVHTNEKPFACQHCEKRFKSEHMMNVHVKNMHKNRPMFICFTCGREYKFKQSFDRHLAEHQGLVSGPTDQCAICGILLKYKCLRKHMELHEAQDIACEICGKIVKKSALHSHKNYAHRLEKSFSCTLCDKTFKLRHSLKEHMDKHTGIKDYNCPHCPKEFRSKSNMYVHIKKKHFEKWSKIQMERYAAPAIEVEIISDAESVSTDVDV